LRLIVAVWSEGALSSVKRTGLGISIALSPEEWNMKMREVILRAIARKITWNEAADVLGISYPAIDRLLRLYRRRGYDGLWVRASRKTFSERVPFATVERILLLYQQKYSHRDARSFHEKLRTKHGIDLPFDWVKQVLHEAGLMTESAAGSTPTVDSSISTRNVSKGVSPFSCRSRSIK
jgi:transposase